MKTMCNINIGIKKNSMDRKIIIIISIVVLLLIAGGVYWYWQTLDKCGDGVCKDIEKGQCPEDCHVVRYLCPVDLYRNLRPYQSGQPLEQFCEKEPQTGIIFMPGDRGYGILSGLVVDDKGNPIPGAQVYIIEKSPIYPIVRTNAQGEFSKRVPAASSRYVAKAKKDGYILNAIGNFEIWDGEETKITITLLPDSVPDADIYSEELFVARIAVTQVDASDDEIIQPDPNAVLDPLLYPDEVKPYLEEGIFSNFNHPVVQGVVQDILESIPEEDRKKQTKVAKAVYLWKIKNVHQDTGKSFYIDHSARGLMSSDWRAGIWGKNFEDWVFRADEAILQKRSICIGGERLAVALLRALKIPARVAPLMAHPVTQWWVQLPDGTGYWANFETSKGNLQYNKDHENLYAAFPSRKDSEITTIPIDGQKTPVQHHMELDNKTQFYEKMQKTFFEVDERSHESIYSVIEKFKQNGEVSGMEDYWGQIPRSPSDLEEYYLVTNVGVNFKLTNLGEQRIVNVSFPLSNAPRHKLCDLSIDSLECEPVEKAQGKLVEYYTNHPEWVEKAEIITEYNDETRLTMKFLNIRFNLETETCGPDNNGYCIDFREKCKTDYRGIGPDICKRGRSAECCVSK